MPAEEPHELRAWAAGIVDREDVTLQRRPGGGRHQAWDVAAADGRRWFLRADAGAPDEHEHYTLRREAELYRAVVAAGLPAPAVLGVHPTREAVLLERMDGAAAFASLPPPAQAELVEDLARWLATLHRQDPHDLGLEVLGPLGLMDEHVREELDIWESRLDATGVPDPVLTACFVWLREHQPATSGRPAVLVQGDTGPGNFLHDGRRITSFLDFELGHLGDPMEDLAWVGTRNAEEPVPDFARFLAAYVEAGGEPPDPPRLRYHALFAELRIAVLGADRLAAPVELDAEHGNQLIYGALHRRLTVEALAVAGHVALPTVDLTPPADTTETRFYDGALHQLREVIAPELADPYVARRLKGLARVLKYLREVDRAGAAPARSGAGRPSRSARTPAELREAAGAAELVARLRARTIDPLDLLPYATAQVTWRTQLLAPAMGVLATRHLPPL